MRFLVILLFGCVFVFGFPNEGMAAPRVGPAGNKGLQELQSLLNTPDSQIDYAKAKLAIDQMIEPSTDVSGTLKQLDAMAAQIRLLLPADANRRMRLVTLMSYLYQPGPWNGGRTFSYDLEDPFGKNLRNKLLTTYLRTRKGNCVSMPILFVILVQKIGLEVTLSTAPAHVLAKYRDDDGSMLNIENVSGGSKGDASYQKEMRISQRAMASGIYLQ